MKGFIIGTIVTAIAFYVVTKFLPQFIPAFITYKGSVVGLLVLMALVLGILALIKYLRS